MPNPNRFIASPTTPTSLTCTYPHKLYLHRYPHITLLERLQHTDEEMISLLDSSSDCLFQALDVYFARIFDPGGALDVFEPI